MSRSSGCVRSGGATDFDGAMAKAAIGLVMSRSSSGCVRSLGRLANFLEKSTLVEVGECIIKMYKFGQIEISSKEFNSVYQIQKDVDLEKIRVS